MRFGILFLLVLACAALALSCAPKESGDDDDDDDSTGGDLTSYIVYINMVPVSFQEIPTAELAVIDESGDPITVNGAVVAEVIGDLEEFAGDAAKFTYDFVNASDEILSDSVGVENLPTFEELQDAVFYECTGGGDLCIGWTQEKEGYHFSGMDGGSLVTMPIDGAFEFVELSAINERDGDQPSLLGETVCARAVVTVGTQVIVDGSYVKTFIQEGDFGVKIFADVGANREDDGYDGSLMSEISTFEGDELFIKGRVTVHNNMIEFVPVSGYHVARLSINNQVPEPRAATLAELVDSPYDYAGSLVRVDDLEIVDVDPDNAQSDWPDYGYKSKEITIRHTGGGVKANLRIYERTGIPGSNKPDPCFDLIGASFVDGSQVGLFARKIEDVNPTDQTLQGMVRVFIFGEDREEPVNLAHLPACLYDTGATDQAGPVVSLASVIRAAGVTRNPKGLEFKPVAYDGRKPFETVSFDEMKCGLLYQDSPSSEEQPDPMVSTHFWEGMELSDIYFLRGISWVESIREIEPPREGDAEHGQGVTLMVNGKKYAINFNTLPKTEYDGTEAIAISEFVPDSVIQFFTMDGSFNTEQIKVLYDYRLVSWDESEEATVTWDDMQNGYLVMEDPPYTVFPDLGSETSIDDLYVVDMMRFMDVDDGVVDPVRVYLRDCDTQSVDVGDGVMEDVVFFGTVLENGGVDLSDRLYDYDLWLTASDEFTSFWTYGHNHVEDMFFRPYANRGFTVDPDMAAYGGRVSTKAVQEISLHEVPQEAPSVPVDIDGDVLWGSDANACEGCHFKHEEIQIPIDCYSCHMAP